MTTLVGARGLGLSRRQQLVRAGSAIVLFAVMPAAFAKSDWLISEDEIATAKKAKDYGAPDKPEGPSSGAPAIVINKPTEGGSIRAPVDFDVRFAPVSPAQIDVGSIRILYSNWLDITSRIREHGGRIDAQGIFLANAPLKPDTYKVTIVVADTTRRTTRRAVMFTVS